MYLVFFSFSPCFSFVVWWTIIIKRKIVWNMCVFVWMVIQLPMIFMMLSTMLGSQDIGATIEEGCNNNYFIFGGDVLAFWVIDS